MREREREDFTVDCCLLLLLPPAFSPHSLTSSHLASSHHIRFKSTLNWSHFISPHLISLNATHTSSRHLRLPHQLNSVNSLNRTHSLSRLFVHSFIKLLIGSFTHLLIHSTCSTLRTRQEQEIEAQSKREREREIGKAQINELLRNT